MSLSFFAVPRNEYIRKSDDGVVGKKAPMKDSPVDKLGKDEMGQPDYSYRGRFGKKLEEGQHQILRHGEGGKWHINQDGEVDYNKSAQGFTPKQMMDETGKPIKPFEDTHGFMKTFAEAAKRGRVKVPMHVLSKMAEAAHTAAEAAIKDHRSMIEKDMKGDIEKKAQMEVFNAPYIAALKRGEEFLPGETLRTLMERAGADWRNGVAHHLTDGTHSPVGMPLSAVARHHVTSEERRDGKETKDILKDDKDKNYHESLSKYNEHVKGSAGRNSNSARWGESVDKDISELKENGKHHAQDIRKMRMRTNEDDAKVPAAKKQERAKAESERYENEQDTNIQGMSDDELSKLEGILEKLQSQPDSFAEIQALPPGTRNGKHHIMNTLAHDAETEGAKIESERQPAEIMLSRALVRGLSHTENAHIERGKKEGGPKAWHILAHKDTNKGRHEIARAVVEGAVNDPENSIAAQLGVDPYRVARHITQSLPDPETFKRTLIETGKVKEGFDSGPGSKSQQKKPSEGAAKRGSGAPSILIAKSVRSPKLFLALSKTYGASEVYAARQAKRAETPPPTKHNDPDLTKTPFVHSMSNPHPLNLPVNPENGHVPLYTAMRKENADAFINGAKEGGYANLPFEGKNRSFSTDPTMEGARPSDYNSATHKIVPVSLDGDLFHEGNARNSRILGHRHFSIPADGQESIQDASPAIYDPHTGLKRYGTKVPVYAQGDEDTIESAAENGGIPLDYDVNKKGNKNYTAKVTYTTNGEEPTDGSKKMAVMMNPEHLAPTGEDEGGNKTFVDTLRPTIKDDRRKFDYPLSDSFPQDFRPNPTGGISEELEPLQKELGLKDIGNPSAKVAVKGPDGENLKGANGKGINIPNIKALAGAVNKLRDNSNKLDEMLEKDPNNPIAQEILTPTTPKAWGLSVGFRKGTDKSVGGFPSKVAAWLKKPKYFTNWLTDIGPDDDPNRIHQSTMDGWRNGIGHCGKMQELMNAGQLDHRTVAMHYIWGALSKSASPYPHEAAFIDINQSPDFHKWLDLSMSGNFKEKHVEEFQQWVKNTKALPDEAKEFLSRPIDAELDEDQKKKDINTTSSPGKSATSNVNDLGNLFLQWGKHDENKENGWHKLHSWHNNGEITGRELRRNFWKEGLGGAGINNKVLSFVSGMLGKEDVMVVDIIQAKNLHNNLYHQLKKRGYGQSQAQQIIAKSYNDVSGLAHYEALEDMMKPLAKNLYRQGKSPLRSENDVFGLHYGTWVRYDNRNTGHGSLNSNFESTRRGMWEDPNTSEPTNFEQNAPPTAAALFNNRVRNSVIEGRPREKTYASGRKYERGDLTGEEGEQHVARLGINNDDTENPSWSQLTDPDYMRRLRDHAWQNHGLALNLNQTPHGTHIAAMGRKGMSPEDTMREASKFAQSMGLNHSAHQLSSDEKDNAGLNIHVRNQPNKQSLNNIQDSLRSIDPHLHVHLLPGGSLRILGADNKTLHDENVIGRVMDELQRNGVQVGGEPYDRNKADIEKIHWKGYNYNGKEPITKSIFGTSGIYFRRGNPVHRGKIDTGRIRKTQETRRSQYSYQRRRESLGTWERYKQERLITKANSIWEKDDDPKKALRAMT